MTTGRTNGDTSRNGMGLLAFVLIALIAGALLATLLPSPAQAQVNSNRYGAIVVDAVNGEVLFEAHADRVLHPASMTKMMTLYMTFQALEAGRLRLDQSLSVSRHADSQPPSHLALPAGSTIRVEDAIYALVTRSANDVAVVLAEGIGGTESQFAEMMTAEARRLGMSRTVFRNASGLPDNAQVSTARDIAILGQALLRDFPQYYHYFGTERWTYHGTTYRNHNRLLESYPGMDGFKTGYIRASGYNLAASAVNGQLRLIAVMFGGESSAERNDHVADLLDRAFASDRGRYLIAHGSVPFYPPLPGRRPAEMPLMLASANAPVTSSGVIGVTGAVASGAPFPRSMETVPYPARPPAQRRTDTPAIVLVDTAPLDALFDEVAQGDGGPEAGLEGDAFSGVWAIQVGAFRDSEEGLNALRAALGRAPHFLTGAEPEILEVATAEGPLYRARFDGLDGISALSACTELTAAGGDCVTIAPLGH